MGLFFKRIPSVEPTPTTAARSHRLIQIPPLPPNSPPSFANNSVSTARYNVATFLPKQLYSQFRKFANLYFLFICCLQAVPGWSPTGRFTTIFPLSIFVFLSMVREAYDDYHRHKADAKENNAPVKRFHNGRLEDDRVVSVPVNSGKTSPEKESNDVRWRDLRVGDIVRIEDREMIPADLVVLSTALPQGACYIETSNLDGETNLKLRNALETTHCVVKTEASLASLRVNVQAEAPNGHLYGFEGFLESRMNNQTTTTTQQSEKFPLTVNQLLLRGSTLRNSGHIYGLVVYTGEESKIRMNANSKPRTKAPAMERTTNKIIVVLFSLILLFASISTGASFAWRTTFSSAWYLNLPFDGVSTFFSFIILYNALIPISLYVTMEMVKLVQIYFISTDLAMYDPVTDRCAEARTSSLNEDLGQVQYIFSDKTGTLTENVMLFRKFCVDGVAYSVKRESPGKAMYNVEDQPADKLIENLKLQQQQQHQQHGGGGGNLGVQSDFLRAIALCHSSLPESSSPSSIIPGRESDATVASNSKSTSGFPMTTTASKSFKDITYQSSSPDDTALVGGARDMSFVFYARVAERIHLHCLGTKDEEYTVLNTIEFSSKRKRMSVICKYPDGSILLLCKGADSVIVERLSQQQQQQSNFKETMRHVERFATEGLRTLLYGYKKLSPAQYDTWAKRFSAASVALERRQERIEEVAEEIETDLILLGATAIEDKLQAGVPETISKLQLAGIRLWMLTGDKRETAINIGYTCQLIKPESRVIILTGSTLKEINSRVDSAIKEVMKLKNLGSTDNNNNTAVVGVHGDEEDENSSSLSKHVVLVADGDVITMILQEEKNESEFASAIFEKFLQVAVTCDNVICCRFSPSQKARIVSEVTKMLKQSPDGEIGLSVLGRNTPTNPLFHFLHSLSFRPTMSGVTLAIGDGANDIPMLESAHVGIGITGREGLAAARASDYSIAQFRFLQQLLLIHGHYNYNRISIFTYATFYKSMAFYLCQMIFQLWTGWSGTSLFEQWTLAVYSIFFSSLPVLAVGVFERDLNKTTLLAVPDLYKSGIVNASFNVRTFLRWTIQGIYHAFMAVLIPVILFQGFASSAVADGASNNNNWSDIISNLPKYVFPTVFFSNLDGPLGESGLYPLGTIVYTLVVFIVTIKIAYIESRTYTIFTHLFVFISLSIWFLYQFAYSRIVAWLNSRLNTGGGPDMGFDAIGLDYQFFNSQPLLWLIILFVCTLTLILCDFTFYAWLRIGNKWDKIFRYLSRHHDAGSLETSSSGSGGGNGARALSTSTNSLNIASSSGHNRSESLKNTQANLAKIALAEWRRLKLRYRDWALLIPWWQKWEAENEVHPDGF